MAKEDIRKFHELLNSDSEFQAKVNSAAAEYTGPQDDKEIFEKVIVPVGNEYGLSATFDEFREYADVFSNKAEAELSEDELAQVAGGKVEVNGGGVGGYGCDGGGIGFGLAIGSKSFGFCCLVGVAKGAGLCLTAGTTINS